MQGYDEVYLHYNCARSLLYLTLDSTAQPELYGYFKCFEQTSDSINRIERRTEIDDIRTAHAMELHQRELAERVLVSDKAVSKWENDQALPDTENMILLADLLDTDIEYLSTGRRNFSRRPPVVVTEVKVVEKVVEKPVIQEKIVEKIVETPVVQYVEKPVIKKVYRVKYRRNPNELLIVSVLAFLLGLLMGALLL